MSTVYRQHEILCSYGRCHYRARNEEWNVPSLEDQSQLELREMVMT
jgi:hypothetical protein